MKKIVNQLLQNHSLIYKVILYVLMVVLIVFLFPKGGKFKYDYFKGKPWQYENYIAPFNFAIQKSQEEINKEILDIERNSKLYFSYNQSIVSKVKNSFLQQLNRNPFTEDIDELLRDKGISIIDKVYKYGFIDNESIQKLSTADELVTIRKGTLAIDVQQKDLIKSSQLLQLINRNLQDVSSVETKNLLLNILSNVIEPNISFDENFTQKVKQDAIDNISYTKGFVAENELIILKGDIVEGKKIEALNSIKSELESQVWSKSNYNWVVFGYSILVALALLMLFLFLRKYRRDIFDDNNKITLIFLNILLIVFLVTIVVKYDAKYVYAVPLCILPIILKAFFDARLGLFTHVLTVLLLGFIVPNSFEFIFLQIIAGIVTILTVSELYKRVNLFVSIGQITMIYMIAYVAFTIIQEGNANDLNLFYFGLFAFNGILAFLATILIFVYERIFGLVSDVSLLELSNTNSTLLRELAEKAPGTFQHSMQVANLAEAVANEIGANSMLVRTGALYHDIGKLNNPMYFTENQSTSVNPHNDLSNYDSAKIIIDHVLDGIEIAKKYRLPDRIIDFIRTHHGTSLVYYFYMQEKSENPDSVNIDEFRYPGPNPFSKETAILMMCDAAEAASKSLKEPTAQAIDKLIDTIVSKQMKEGQFMNANITFKDLELVKKILKKKLKNIYHLRIEYPE
ncbi:HD family phosphohydrolase [Urechidicola croceus]|uniref:Phosphohydrolase n=1 Tax=Urechidicola croceus TaxID=1850246 RepID=A0A1D8P698_9FLAO|nr:HDIG domain-containing metalloprotein [Urechidicola croceus]AOW20072.1 phosphohydrolase [Urechidicola croceus]